MGFCVKCLSAGLLGVNHLSEVKISTSPSSLPQLNNNKGLLCQLLVKASILEFCGGIVCMNEQGPVSL